ncbi:MAG TPA: coenzyme F420-0:L-glutamate ligase [Nitrososphaerales archaeon]|nr:coenzyme F420-0:L-glutamate ligase [Nitrososphaerales archaeon]
MPRLVDDLVGDQVKKGDVLVVSSKFIAISEGRVVSLSSVNPGERAMQLSSQYGVQAELCELILKESDSIVGGVPGFILTLWNGLLTPNAGIDKSNIEHGRVVLYPEDPLESAVRIADELRKRRGVSAGVVVSDSRLTPTRTGTVGVALAAVGIQALHDMRGHPDLFGNPLKVTRQAVADDLCTGAQLVMGEADEATPVVLVRGLDTAGEEETRYAPADFAIPVEQCVFMGSLGYPRKEGSA